MCKYIDISYLEYGLLDSRIGCYRVESDIRIILVKDGLVHCEKGPAIIWADGVKEFYINNKRHRDDGPAIIYTDKRKEYSLNGKKYSIEDFINKLSGDMLQKFLINKDNF